MLPESRVSYLASSQNLCKVPRNESSENHTESQRAPTASADPNQAALNTLRMDVETQNLVGTVKELLVLTRQMKELWLFGSLDTMGKSGAVEQTENDAQVVAGLVQELLTSGTVFEDTTENIAHQNGS